MILENKMYKISNVEGKSTDIRKLLYSLDTDNMVFDSLYIRYDKEGYNNCFIYKGNKVVSEFKVNENTEGNFLAENYFPLGEMGYSYRDPNQFQYQLLIKKHGRTISLVFENVDEYDYEWLRNNQLDENIIITLAN